MVVRWCRNAFAYLSGLGVTAADDDTVRLQKTAFMTVSVALLAPWDHSESPIAQN